MTREYFDDYVTEWDELIDLCSSFGCSICENIFPSEAINEMILDDIKQAIETGRSWDSICDDLTDINQGCEYYRVDGFLEYEDMDDCDFSYYKGDVESLFIDNGYFEEEDDDDDEDEWCDEEAVVTDAENKQEEEELFTPDENDMMTFFGYVVNS